MAPWAQPSGCSGCNAAQAAQANQNYQYQQHQAYQDYIQQQVLQQQQNQALNPQQPSAMPGWLVTEPDANLWLIDTPLRYNVSRGKAMKLKLFLKNQQGPQGASENGQAKIFSLGSHWHSPWRSYVEPVSGESTNFWVYPGNGTAVKFTLDAIDYQTRRKLTQVSSTNVLQLPDGGQNIYGYTSTVGAVTRYFLTSQVDPQGNAVQFQYTVTNDTIVLSSVTDVDSRSTTFQYASAGIYSNVMTQVNGPYGLTNLLQYDSSGRLTNITDLIGIASAMQYDSSTNLTALITPYGTNKFTYFSTYYFKLLNV